MSPSPRNMFLGAKIVSRKSSNLFRRILLFNSLPADDNPPFTPFEMNRKRASDTTSKAPSPKKQKSLDNFVKKTSQPSSTPKNSPTNDSWLANLVIEISWKNKLNTEFGKPYVKKIETFLAEQYQNGKKVFPPKNQIFNALNLTPLSELKVVIIGQDPYHDNGQAHGLSFSVPAGIEPPPSLKNIYKELTTDIVGFKTPNHGCLEKWAKGGVLLLNAALTVEAHKANSHASIGWHEFTDAVIKIVSKECNGVVFILWGGFAHKKEKLVDAKKHHVIKAAHPSPLSVTKFLGCKCFSKANEALVNKYGKSVVDWNLD